MQTLKCAQVKRFEWRRKKRRTERNRKRERERESEKEMMETEQKSKAAYRKIDPWHSVRPSVAFVPFFLFPFHPHSLDFLFGGQIDQTSE